MYVCKTYTIARATFYFYYFYIYLFIFNVAPVRILILYKFLKSDILKAQEPVAIRM